MTMVSLFKTEERQADRQTTLDIHLNQGGGFVMLLQPRNESKVPE
jgi:hypothetical protein